MNFCYTVNVVNQKSCPQFSEFFLKDYFWTVTLVGLKFKKINLIYKNTQYDDNDKTHDKGDSFMSMCT